MKAIVLTGFGGVENLVMRDISVPVISDSEVLVEVKAISINPVDIKTRKGKGVASILKESDPMILGWDISGTVISTGRNAGTIKEGDEVFGMVNFPGHGKAYAEYVAVPGNQLAIKPVNITHEEAAAASLAALTAWQILKEKVRIKKGDRVLIHSAAGGVGHFAVQISNYLGAEVIGTASAANKDFILGIGAGRHIDYEKERFENGLNDIDFILDTIGGEYIDRSFKVLRPGGTIVCIPSGASENIVDKARERGLIGSHFRVQSDGGNMNEISRLLGEKIIKPFISKTYSLDEIRSAHLQIETGKTKGKIVVVFR